MGCLKPRPATMQFGVLCALFVLLALFSTADAKSTAVELRQQELLKKAAGASDGILELDEGGYDTLLSIPRDYSITILFTATSPKFGCAACLMFKDAYRHVARGWRKTRSKQKHVFAVVEAEENMNVFRRNQFTHAPITRTYLASHTGESKDPLDYDVSMRGFTDDDFANYISGILGVQVKPKKPFFTTGRVLRIGLIALVTCVLGTIYYKFDIRHALRVVIMLISLAMIFTFTSGYMWIQIRRPPFIQRGQDGSIELFAGGGFGQQHGVESPLLITLYAFTTLCCLLLTNVAPRIQSSVLQRVVVYFGMIGVLVACSGMIDFYRRKNGTYPFRLFF